jgi:vesicle coat complex subunit
MLTAVVKLYLKKPQSQALLQQILQSATAECDNPDIRDRAYIYWRLLSKDPGVAKVFALSGFGFSYIYLILFQSIVLSDKPPISSTIQNLPSGLLEQLLTEISTLASVYHKPPETFVGEGRFGAEAVQKRAIEYER